LSCAKYQIKFGAESLCKEDPDRKLSFSLYAPTVARFAVESKHPPHLTETIILADRVHAALVSLSNGSSIFTGCDEQGRPLQGNRHSHVFCESNIGLGNGTDGEITHITVYAPMGFESENQSALQDLKEVWSGDDIRVKLLLLGQGLPQDFGGVDLERGQCPLLTRAKTWISRTPFLHTHHPKYTRAGVPKVDDTGLQKGSPEHELLRLLELAGFPEPETVEPVASTCLGGRDVPWHDFLRRRGERRPAANGAGYGFRIEFPEPVQGPVAVGYASHFGMGGFEIETTDGQISSTYNNDVNKVNTTCDK
jgi:CRISPR-associated protein Csb2